MNITELFIRRPVATTLLTIGIALTGIGAYFQLPVSSLPAVDLPTIQVQANLPGASPSVMSTSVATPLERRLGQIADVTEMTSTSSVGNNVLHDAIITWSPNAGTCAPPGPICPGRRKKRRVNEGSRPGPGFANSLGNPKSNCPSDLLPCS